MFEESKVELQKLRMKKASIQAGLFVANAHLRDFFTVTLADIPVDSLLDGLLC